MKTLIFIVVISSFLHLGRGRPLQCPYGWSEFRDSCVLISSQQLSWHEANSFCRRQRGVTTKLLNIWNKQDNDLMKEMLQNRTKDLNTTQQFYFGLYGKKVHNSNQLVFTWLNDTNKYNFSDWRFINETNGTMFNNGDWRCAYYEENAWRLGNCSNKANFICQQDKAPPICWNGWHEIADFCIYLSNTSKTWKDSLDACRSMDKHSYLVLLKFKDKDNQVIKVLQDNVQNASEFYIALHRPKNSTFRWIDGNMYNHTNWHSINETENTSETKNSCAYYGTEYKWRLDVGCEAPKRYICQRRKWISTAPDKKETNPTKKTKHSDEGEKQIYVSSSTPKPTTIPSSVFQLSIEARINSLKGKKISDELATQQLQATMKVLTEFSQFNKMSDIKNVIANVERMGDVLIAGMKKASKNSTEPKKIQVKNNVMVLGVTLMPANSSSEVQFPENDSGGSITLPKAVLQLAEQSQNTSDGVGMTSLFLPGVGEGQKQDGDKPVLNSGIMSTKVAVPEGTIQNLKEPVVIALPHVKQLTSEQKAVCSFIVPKSSEYSTVGCTVAENLSNSSHTVCHCTHLTSFAVLLDVHGHVDQTPIEHRLPLLIVSIVGCCIAWVCFTASLFAFHLVISERRRRKTETIAIHKNLAVAEILALSFFLLAYGVTEPTGLCYAFALLLHYSLMAVFFWMLVEGLNLHRGTVQVFITSSRMKVYYILGWGIPCVFVIVTAAIGQLEYARKDFCWISQQFIWAFAGPVCVILLINFIILCIAIRVVIKRPRYKSNRVDDSNKSQANQELRIAFKTTVILLPLLGLTWFLGFLSTHSAAGNVAVQYLFAILNSLQGAYFFLAHCMYDEDVIRATNNTSTRLKTYFSRTLSRSQPSNSSTSHGKRSGGYFDSSFKKPNKDIVFEMPSMTASSNNKHNADPPLENPKYVDTTPDGVICSKTNDALNVESLSEPDLRQRSNIVSSDSSSTENSHLDKKDLGPLKEEVGSPGEVFFRRAKSAIWKLSTKTATPRRSNSIAEPTRLKLSKQTSNDSNISGASNTAFLSGC